MNYLKKLLLNSTTLTLLTAAMMLSNASAQNSDAKQAKEDIKKETPTLEEFKKMVILKTSAGDIEIELNAEKAPESVANFLEYAKSGHYDGLIFHRVIKGFMIQGGGFEPGMKQKETRAPIVNEAQNGLLNEKYSLAMARTPDPHSASSQFFVNTNDNAFLNFSSETQQGWGYAVFGKVVNGQEVVDTIENVATGQSNGFTDVPTEDVVIQSVVIAE